MPTTLWLLLIAPLVWPAIAKLLWSQEITWGEFAANVLLGCALTSAVYIVGRNQQMADTQILNGQVTGKSRKTVPCSHSYSCNCDSKGNCSTCYDHSEDYDWKVYSSAGSFEIDRIDRQGRRTPPRFASVKNGEAVSLEDEFDNYVKAVPDSLFSHIAGSSAVKKFEGKIPPYPGRVYDYHRLNRVLAANVQGINTSTMSQDLSEMLKTLGPRAKANVVVVFAGYHDEEFATALGHAWLNGKKNDVIVILGTPAYPAIAWVKVISWTKNEYLKGKLEQVLREQETVVWPNVLSEIEKQVSAHFHYRDMEDFAYLKSLIEPPEWVIWLAGIVGLLGSVLISLVVSEKLDILHGSRYGRRW